MLTANLTVTAENETTDTNLALSDDALVLKAKGLNKSMERHVTKGIEAFWDLGETLAQLFKRRHLQENGKWADVLKQVNISTTTDSQARRFFASCLREDLPGYKNKTAALRALNIIATPETAKTKPTKLVNKPNETGTNEAETGKTEADETGTDETGTDETEIGKHQPNLDENVLTLHQLATRLESLVKKGLVTTADHDVHLDRILAAVAQLKQGVALAV